MTATSDSGGSITVLDPGADTTVQDYPGRLGWQHKGFFPAGPMDRVALQVANQLVGNEAGAAALEIPMGRFAARFDVDASVALCGAGGAEPTIDDIAVPEWESIHVTAGSVLSAGTTSGPGFRLYLAVTGGIDVAPVLGSRATHTVAGIGGRDGRALIRGDVLPVGAGRQHETHRRLPERLRPQYPSHAEIEVLRGPHADPDFLTTDDWHELTSRTWRVDLNSDRLATLLDTHRFTWARQDGGVAGGHPSNILDGSFPIGGIIANGDVPMILGPDGTTSGGFTVLATIAHAALWRIGQLRPGRDTVRFREIGYDEAIAIDQRLEFDLDPMRLERC